MAKIKRQYCPSGGWSCTYIKSLFESFNSDRISVEVSANNRTATVHIDDDKFAIEFYMRDAVNSDWLNVYVHVGSSRSGNLFDGCKGADTHITVSIGNNFVYVAVKDNWGRRCMFYCSNIDNETYYTYTGNGSSQSIAFYNMTGRSLTRLSDGVTFSYGAMLNYAREVGKIDYSNGASLFSGSAKTDINDTDLVYCSTVTVDAIYTFEDSNYYAFGTNVLIPID